MKAYQLSIPTKVYFGRNILEEALEACNEYLKGNILVVTTGRSLVKMGHLDRLKKSILHFGNVNEIISCQEISANPRLSEIQKGIMMGKQRKADVVVGFGGGSALDAAKAIAAGVGMDIDIYDIFRKGLEPSKATLPVIAIPTTAGTGSELSKAAIITDEEQGKKGGIRGTALYPSAAIVDSVFTETIPFRVTMETGFDVLAHAIETYISKAATPFTEMLSEQAIKIVGEYLPRLAGDLDDVEAREKMSFASMIMGVNLGNASTCLPHRMQYPVGAHTDTSHGAGLAAMYPTWVKYEYEYSREKIEYIFNSLLNESCDSRERAAELMRKFLEKLQLYHPLRELGIAEEMIADMTAEVTGNIHNDPAAIKLDIIRKIYRGSL